MPSHDHPLFKQYPLNGQTTISTGLVPTPYHIYDGNGLFLGGTADLAAVRDLLKGEGLSPIRTRAGSALMGVWVCNFTEASLGPHHELQFSIFGSVVDLEPVEDNPLAVLKLLLTRSDVLMMCHGLWNNTVPVVAYNREVLGLNAALADSRIDYQRGSFVFDFTDHATQTPLLSGRINNPEQASARANFNMVALMGFGPLMAAAQQPWLTVRIVSPQAVWGRNAIAESFTKNDTNVIRYFGDNDIFRLGPSPYANLGFRPQFSQFMTGFKFVYLNPK